MLTARDQDTITNTGFDPYSWHEVSTQELSCDLLTVQQAAAVTGITEATIHAWIRSDHIRAIRPSSGGLYLDEFEFVDCAEKMIGYKTRVTRQVNIKNHDKPAQSDTLGARLVTASEAYELVGVPKGTVRGWASKGSLKSRGHRGASPLYDIDEICELASHQSPSALISKAQAAISFAIDALETNAAEYQAALIRHYPDEPETDTAAYGDIYTVLLSLHAAQDALEIVIVGRPKP